MATTSGGLESLVQRVTREFRSGAMSAPIDTPDVGQPEAYRVQYRLIDTLKERGETVSGHKVALTTHAAREHLGVGEPCFGHIMDRGVYLSGSEISLDGLADPHIEGEIAFLMGDDLKGPGVTPVQVMRATQAVFAALELVDLKVGEGIKATDVIVHNSFQGGVVAGSRLTPLAGLDLQYEGVTVEYNGAIHGTGTGIEVMGNPVNSVQWLANKLAEFGDYLKAGEMIISGSIVMPVRVKPGDHVSATYTRLGSVSARFV